MKTPASITTAAVLTVLLSCIPARAAQTIIAISPALPDMAAKDQVYRTVLTTVLSDIAPGDTLHVLDGHDVRKVATFTVPNHQAYARDPKARAKSMQAAIQSFNQWLVADSASRAAIPANSLRAPAIFEYCATHTDLPKEKGTLILIGSTIYDDPTEPAFSMKDGYYPSDPHLGATRQESVFGLKNAVNRLNGTIVHWASLGATYQDDGNRASVERFWSGYCTIQGATLASCDGDAATVFQRVKAGTSVPIQRVTLETGGKLEMRHAPIRIRVPAAAQPAQAVDSTTPPPQAAPAAAAAPAPTEASQPGLGFMFGDSSTEPLGSPTVDGCKIGIRWPGNRDIDLYVRPAPGASELYYKVNRSREGIHVKDWLTSPEVDNNGFETVEIRGPVDLRQLTIGVNFYHGEPIAEGVDGTIRIEAGGRVFQSPFHIRSSTGNGGADSANRHRSPYWTVLDPMVITKQR